MAALSARKVTSTSHTHPGCPTSRLPDSPTPRLPGCPTPRLMRTRAGGIPFGGATECNDCVRGTAKARTWRRSVLQDPQAGSDAGNRACPGAGGFDPAVEWPAHDFRLRREQCRHCWLVGLDRARQWPGRGAARDHLHQRYQLLRCRDRPRRPQLPHDDAHTDHRHLGWRELDLQHRSSAAGGCRRRPLQRRLCQHRRLLGGRHPDGGRRKRELHRRARRELERHRLVGRRDTDTERQRGRGRIPPGGQLHVTFRLHRRGLHHRHQRREPQRPDRAVERVVVDHRPRGRHRPDLRRAHARRLPQCRRLLGGWQFRTCTARSELPTHLSRRRGRSGADRALGRVVLVGGAQYERTVTRWRLPLRRRLSLRC